MSAGRDLPAAQNRFRPEGMEARVFGKLVVAERIRRERTAARGR